MVLVFENTDGSGKSNLSRRTKSLLIGSHGLARSPRVGDQPTRIMKLTSFTVHSA